MSQNEAPASLPKIFCFSQAVLPFPCNPRSAQALGCSVAWKEFGGLAGLVLSVVSSS